MTVSKTAAQPRPTAAGFEAELESAGAAHGEPLPVIVLSNFPLGVVTVARILKDLGVHAGDQRSTGSRDSIVVNSAVDRIWVEFHRTLKNLNVRPRKHVKTSKERELRRKFINVARLLGRAKAERAAALGQSRWLLAEHNSVQFLDWYAEAFPKALYVICLRESARAANPIGNAPYGAAISANSNVLEPSDVAIAEFLKERSPRAITLDYAEVSNYDRMYTFPFGMLNRLRRFLGGDEPNAPLRSAMPGLPPARLTTNHPIVRPVFIIACPRSGSTMLLETLSASETFWTWGGEGHSIWEQDPLLRPENRGWESHRLTAADASPAIQRLSRDALVLTAKNLQGESYLELAGRMGGRSIRYLEKTPRNSLRVSFLNALFPDAVFIYLVRDGRANVSSLIEGWTKDNWIPEVMPLLPGFWISDFDDPRWRFPIVPGWRELSGKRLEEVCAQQYATMNGLALDDLEGIGDPNRVMMIHFETLVEDPPTEIRRICDFAGIPFDASLARRTLQELPQSRSVLSAPDRRKWEKLHKQEIERTLPIIEPVMTRLGYRIE